MTEAAALARRLRALVSDARVLEAIGSLERARFVPVEERDRAYENVALPIGCGQTISQPLVVARMLEVLEPGPDDRVLDVGTGSGYHAALLAMLGGHVWTVERHPELSRLAAQVLHELGVGNVTLVVGDGSRGLPEHAPFDAINIAAAAEEEVPSALAEQLAPGGRLVVPVGERSQRLMLIRRTGNGFERVVLEQVRFVPLVQDRDDDAPGAE
jgi:protein-L-isoaspartate(D-aspartate) O-methyltransferase